MKRNSSVAPNRVTVLYLRKKHINDGFLMLYFLFYYRWKILHWNFDNKRNVVFPCGKKGHRLRKTNHAWMEHARFVILMLMPDGITEYVRSKKWVRR
jgi:hypothetical protein